LLGAISAILSCITGYILSDVDSYEEDLKNWHQWMGISTAVLSLIVYYFSRRPEWGRWLNSLSLLMLAGIVITGHLGGSLTHGSDYFSKPIAELLGAPEKVEPVFKKPIPDIQEAVVYRDLIHPIFQARCAACHGEKKQRGKLRLDDPSGILEGGKSGKAIVPGKPDLGELIKRITLPPESKDHMPPKGKPQLTDNEVALVKWWLADSADFEKKVHRMNQPTAIKPVLVALQEGVDTQSVKTAEVPEKPVDPAPEQVMNILRSRGIVVLPVAKNSNYLSVSFVIAPVEDSSLALLEKLADQLVWLNMSGSPLSDKGLQRIGRLPQLTKLYLNGTQVTDSGLSFLKPLKRLQYLNLVHTGISQKGLEKLAGLKGLKNIYCYQTKIHSGSWPYLSQVFPQAKLDTGGYQVPTFVTDTSIYKRESKK
ncbi:MAG TPA: c-type cytochrome domain-containing protein, partial [Puia sp.]